MRLLSSLVVGWLCFGLAPAWSQTVAETQKQALEKYPELTRPDSTFKKVFALLYEHAKRENPALLAKTDWPLVLARRTAAALGMQEPEEAPPAEPTSATVPTGKSPGTTDATEKVITQQARRHAIGDYGPVSCARRVAC